MKKACLLLLCFAALQAFAATTLPPLKIEPYSLPNGLTVFLYEDHATPIVSVNINYMVGSKNEKIGKTGFAHLFEHMMFQGSKHFNDDFFKPLQDVGGEVNGATNQDRTRYYEVVPSNYLERALWLESDRMGFLLDAMTQERLDNQRSVVKNEKRQNYDDAPYGKVYGEILKTLYPPDHPYSWTTIGSHEDLDHASLDDVKDFFKTYYTPSNAVLTIAGDFNPAEAKKLIEKYFASIPAGPPVLRLASWVPAIEGIKREVMQDRVQLARLYLMWPTIPQYAAGDAELDLFAKAFGQGKTSRLYQKLVKEKGLVSEISASHDSGQLAGSFQITATALPGKSLQDIEKAVLDEMKAALEKGITKEELEQGQNTYAADFIRGLERVGGFRSISDQIGSYYHYLGRPDAFQWDLDRYQTATQESVLAAARAYLNPRTNYGAIEVYPYGNFKTGAEKVDRDKMPGKSGELALKLPEPKEFTLENGMKVITLPYSELPVASMRLILPVGAYADPKDAPGRASFTAGMLTEGTTTRSAEAITSTLDFLGSTLSVNAGPDGTTMRASALLDKLPETLNLMADVLTHPSFPDKELAIQKKRRASDFMRRQDSVYNIAGATLTKNLYAGHPYGHLDIGTPQSVEKTTAKDLADFHKTYYQPQIATLIFVGNKTPEELKTLLQPFAKAWPKGSLKTPAVPATSAPKEKHLYFVDKPGAAQSLVSVAILGLERTNPDYVPALVFNHLYGGYFGSRLNMNLREEHGYTYGARSQVTALRVKGAWSAGAPVQKDSTAESIAEILKEIQGLLGAKPVTQEEFDKVKGNMVQSQPARYETPEDLASRMEDIALYGLPLDTLNKDYQALLKVTPADVMKIGKKYYQDAKLQVVVVGDKEKVFDKVKALNLGPAVFCDKLGNVIEAK